MMSTTERILRYAKTRCRWSAPFLLQQGIVSDEARRLAEGAGIDYVEDRCMAVEGGLHRILVS